KLPPRTVKSTPAISSYDSPNLISTAFIKGASAVNSSAKKARLNTEHTVRSTAYSTYSGLRAVGISTTQGITTTAKSIASGTTYAIKQVSRGTATAAKSVGRGITVAVNAPANAINNMPSAKSFVRPADHTTTPVIE